MANPVSFDSVTGKPIFGNDISNPASQFQAVADYAEKQGPQTVPTFGDLAAVENKRPGMKRLVVATGSIYTYISASLGWVPDNAPVRKSQVGASVASIAFPSGTPPVGAPLIIQSGLAHAYTSAAFGNGYFPTVTFPTAFPNACLAVQITPIYSATLTPGSPAIDTTTPTTFRALWPGGGVDERAFFWTATGY